jgi:hypothetical protein
VPVGVAALVPVGVAVLVLVGLLGAVAVPMAVAVPVAVAVEVEVEVAVAVPVAATAAAVFVAVAVAVGEGVEVAVAVGVAVGAPCAETTGATGWSSDWKTSAIEPTTAARRCPARRAGHARSARRSEPLSREMTPPPGYKNAINVSVNACAGQNT